MLSLKQPLLESASSPSRLSGKMTDMSMASARPPSALRQRRTPASKSICIVTQGVEEGPNAAEHVFRLRRKGAVDELSPEPRLKRKQASRNLGNRRSQYSRSPEGRRPRYSLSKSPLWQNLIDRSLGEDAQTGTTSLAALPNLDPCSFESAFKSTFTTHYQSDPPEAFGASETLETSHYVDTAPDPAVAPRLRPATHFKTLPSLHNPFSFSTLPTSPFSSPPRHPQPSTHPDSTSTSLVSLSLFPRPPSRRQGRSKNNISDSSAEPQSPQTPTRFHFRGASFDVINPHQSLGLRDVLTPDDTEQLDDDLVAPPPVIITTPY